jgi:uncharacterized repeat protein (TIGR02543 family)
LANFSIFDSGTAYGANLQSAGHIWTSHTIPSDLSINANSSGQYRLVVTSMNISALRPSGTASIRARIWQSNGTSLAYGTLVQPASGTSTPVNSDRVSSSFPGSLSGVTSPIPVLTRGTTYRFGGFNNGDIRYGRRITSGKQTRYELSVTANQNSGTGTLFDVDSSGSSALNLIVNYIFAPSAPRTSSTTNTRTASSITINWLAPTSDGDSAITGYFVRIRQSGGTYSSWTAASGSTSHTFTGLSSNTTYDFQVAAANAATEVMGTNIYSQPLSGSLATQANTITISYNANGGSSTPNSQTATPGESFTTAAAITRSGFTFAGWVSGGTTYLASTSYTAPTSNLTLTASWTANPPSEPTNLAITDFRENRLTLSWAASSNAADYQTTLNGVNVATTTSLTYTFQDLSPDVEYTLGVRARNPGGASSLSIITGRTLKATFTVESVIGDLRDSAITALIEDGFSSVSVILVKSGAIASNNLKVVSQTPPVGATATVGDVAEILVYNYELPTPNLIGLTEQEALDLLALETFESPKPSLTEFGATAQNNLTVGTQSPTPGTDANPRNDVSFTIFNFLTQVPNVVGQNADLAITTLGNLGFVNVTTILDENGATADNVNTVKSQTPVNSSTTYNPKNQPVTIVVYSLGISGRIRKGSDFSPITTARRFDGTEWKTLTVQRRFDGTAWRDISN